MLNKAGGAGFQVTAYTQTWSDVEARIGNRHQVKYVGSKHVEWSHEGRGNFWSDHPAFDLDGDGRLDLITVVDGPEGLQVQFLVRR